MKPSLLRSLAVAAVAVWAAGPAVAAETKGAPARTALIDGPLPGPVVVGGLTYVPAHSTVRAGDGRTRIGLAVTLTVHNASESDPLVVDRIDYYDGTGQRVQRHLEAPVALRPFGTLEIFVAKNDPRGGTGANFVVGWGAAKPIAEPVIETVTIGEFGNQSYAFVSTGRRITIVGAGAP